MGPAKILRSDAGKYLGFWLGPQAGRLLWNAPLKKFNERVDRIYTSVAAISISPYTYNVKAIPVVSYIAQLAPPPTDIRKIELLAIHRITHCARNALTFGDFLSLRHAGGPELRFLSISMFSALYRSARKTVLCWPDWCSQLKAAAQEWTPLMRWAKGYYHLDFWDSHPFACNLQEASQGFPSFRLLSAGVSMTLQEITQNPLIFDHSLQKVTYENLLACSFELNRINETILKRITSIFSPYDLSTVD